MNRWSQFLKASAIAAFMTATASLSGQAYAQEKTIVVASTTSTQDSGLFGYLLPIVKEKTGIVVKVLAQGAG
jgi:tungstate transport system substrate-binding protein